MRTNLEKQFPGNRGWLEHVHSGLLFFVCGVWAGTGIVTQVTAAEGPSACDAAVVRAFWEAEFGRSMEGER
ncbi:MAG: hypothetical protein NTV46_01465, partial [Verrucomicrobia bacterium]|nr:hypothetical protein [Verrucomicrobiota bacterium]